MNIINPHRHPPQQEGASGGSGGSGGALFQSTIYDFNSEAINTGNGWSPSTAYAADGWVNGTSAVNGTQWSSGTNTQGINSKSSSTSSSNTGPAGGMTSVTNGTPSTSSSQKYLYKETSANRHYLDHLARTPGYNFSTLMSDTTNDLRMVFWYHAYGATTWNNDLYTIYTDTATTSNSTTATQLQTLGHSGNLMSQSTDAYIIQYVDLNSYRTINSTHYFYILLNSQTAGTGYRHDIAIDTVYFEEY
tara:strand:- start:41 stop:781 length:741 start_codon:yes stop_codon:yes gene_type:complete